VDHTFQSSDAHERAAQSIPWLVNGTLPADEAVALRVHVAHCARCRSDYEAEKRLYEAIRGDGPLVFAGEPSFAKLMARIEAHDDAILDDGPEAVEPRAPSGGPVAAAIGAEPAVIPLKSRAARTWRTSAAVRWLAAAVVIEAALLAVGPFMRHAPQPASVAPYQTLTSPALRYGTGPRVRVVFRSNLTLEALQKLLRTVDAHIVDGPTDAQVFTLGFSAPVTSAELDARVATLRASSQVLFAEIAPQDTAAR
jgi:hypothetical protein